MANGITTETIQKEYWEKKKSVPEIARVNGVSAQTIYELMRKHKLPRRSYTESNYLVNKDKPQFSPKRQLTPREQKLKVAGLMLYWAEGARGEKSGVLDFANSNADMIQLFLLFLRRICGVSETRLRIYLYHHGNASRVRESMAFWEQKTQIPLRQFSRPYIRKGNAHRSQRIMPHGLVHIRYSDKRLLKLIHEWIRLYTCTFRADTKVVNWGRL